MKTAPITLTAAAILLLLLAAAQAAEGGRDDAREPARETPAAEPDRPQEKHPHRADTRGERRTWLGVATTPVAPSLHEHLQLDDGFGIQVRKVLEGSPAHEADLRPADVLMKFDEQRLTTPQHLSLLVRGREKGDEVSLTLLRKGETETVSVALGETDPANLTRRELPAPRGRFDAPRPPRLGDGATREWKDSVKRYQDRWREWMERREAEREERRGDKRGKRRDSDTPAPDDAKGRPPAVSVSPGFPVTVFGSEGVIEIDNQEGKVTITRREGEHHIEIRDAEGALVHEGEYDPERGTASLPKKAREQLEIMKLDNLEVLAPRSGDEMPEKTTADPNPDEKPVDETGNDVL